MPVERTGVSVAAIAASEALELLAAVIKVSNPKSESLIGARLEADNLRGATAEDVAAYNQYLVDHDLRPAIEVPLRAARSVLAGLGLCEAMRGSVKASVSADLGVVEALLRGALRGILLCLEANLKAVEGNPDFDALRAQVARLTALRGGS